MRPTCLLLAIFFAITSAQAALPERPRMTSDDACRLLVDWGWTAREVKRLSRDRAETDRTLKTIARRLQGTLTPRERALERTRLYDLVFPIAFLAARRLVTGAAYMDPEDFFDGMHLAMERIIEQVENGRYEPDRSNRFYTWAHEIVYYSVLRFRRPPHRRLQTIDPRRLDRRASENERPSLATWAELRDLFRPLLDSLPRNRDRDFLLRSALGETLEQIGQSQEPKISTERVRQIRARALRYFRSRIRHALRAVDPTSPLSTIDARYFDDLGDDDLVTVVALLLRRASPADALIPTEEPREEAGYDDGAEQ